MNLIKIAHVTTVDNSLRDLLLNQLRSLRAEGYDVSGISAPGVAGPLLEANGIHTIPVPMSRNLTPFADLLSLWRLYRIMRRERFTIVHTHTPKAGLLGQLAARLAGVPIVVNTVHGFYFHDHMRPLARRGLIFLERLGAWCSDLILSQNQEDIQTACRERIGHPAKLRYLGNGIDLHRFDPDRISADELAQTREECGLPEDAPVIGFVGRLAARRKGFLDFLAAAQKVAAQCPDVHFLILGEPDRGKPDAVSPERAADYGIADRCHFRGLRPNHELPRHMALMNLLVLPSLFEGVPRVIMEASAMGVPSLASDVKGNREAVFHERNGWLVPLGDVEALSAVMMQVIADPQTAREMSIECRAIARTHFDEQRVFAKVKASYASLLALHNVDLEEEKACADSIVKSGSLPLK